MNEQIILNMARPYIRDGQLTYDDFDGIYSILSRKEQYAVTEILFKNGIGLVDEHIGDTVLVLNIDDHVQDDMDYDDDFEIRYDDNLFRDKGIPEQINTDVFINRTVRQSNEILCSLIQRGSRQAAQDLCVKNQRLVDKYVQLYEHRYGNRLDFEDLEQAGYIGLIKAAQKFSIEQGTAFSTYAVFWIKQSITREIMDNGYAIRIPVHMMERINRVVASNNRLEALGTPFAERIPIIAKEWGYTEENVHECLALKANYLTYTSLDAPIGEDGDMALGDFVPMEEDDSVEKLIADKELRIKLEKVLTTLKPKEQEILKLRVGWKDGIVRTLEEIGSQYNVTRERIRQIESKALRKLRHPSRLSILKDFWEE